MTITPPADSRQAKAAQGQKTGQGSADPGDVGVHSSLFGAAQTTARQASDCVQIGGYLRAGATRR